MPGFHYTALTTDGDTTTGTLTADSPRLARQALREKGLAPLAVEELASVPRHRRFSFERRLSSRQLALATRQLAGLLSSGVPLVRGLGAVAEQAESATARHLFAAVRADVMEGKSFADALRAKGEAFPPSYAPLAEAGERTGSLGAVFMKLADAVEKSADTRRKVTLALAYPAVLTVVSLGAVVALMTVVVPRIVEVFEVTRQTLPLLTRWLIALSGFMADDGWLVGLIAVAFIGAVVWALRDERQRHTFHERLLRLPALGRLLTANETVRFASSLAILTSGGAPLLFSLETAKASLSLLPMRAAVADAIEGVRQGGSLSDQLSRSKRFPLLLVSYVANGESDGDLGRSLGWAEEHLRRDLSYRIETFTALFEPLLILCMGGLVLLIVLAALLPIFDMNLMVR